MDHQIKMDLAAEKLSDMAGLVKALCRTADEIAAIAPGTWARVESKLPWFPEIGEGAVRILDNAASECERAE
jgi:hypothetical protein